MPTSTEKTICIIRKKGLTPGIRRMAVFFNCFAVLILILVLKSWSNLTEEPREHPFSLFLIFGFIFGIITVNIITLVEMPVLKEYHILQDGIKIFFPEGYLHTKAPKERFLSFSEIRCIEEISSGHLIVKRNDGLKEKIPPSKHNQEVIDSFVSFNKNKLD